MWVSKTNKELAHLASIRPASLLTLHAFLAPVICRREEFPRLGLKLDASPSHCLPSLEDDEGWSLPLYGAVALSNSLHRRYVHGRLSFNTRSNSKSLCWVCYQSSSSPARCSAIFPRHVTSGHGQRLDMDNDTALTVSSRGVGGFLRS
ncbi:hypothetical protein K504DRAFT_133534 [Pleomassaria siparia CBS 279.74]|uniref:Uncharacterized protein n=1 Tax=Pleomassaria siparia CBS 279.74 TaxID=1314801 RepID=A0A6G1KLF3_9PLEO|nr:hypothetical protein K504DRAFT_133534 [Pleomassaria siparia CBS 279.74]